jgi:Domain of unknown function (DUF305)
MPLNRLFIAALAASLLAAPVATPLHAGPPAGGEQPFLAQNRQAMDRMMAAMAVRPTGEVDADFAAMMIPHHQGAIDMAVLELRYGRNEQLRRIAQEIIVDQQQEIAAMRLALGQSPPASAPAPTQGGAMSMPVPMPMSTGAPASAAGHALTERPE